MISIYFRYRLFDVMFELIIPAICRTVISVYSGCHNFVFGVVQDCVILMTPGIESLRIFMTSMKHFKKLLK